MTCIRMDGMKSDRSAACSAVFSVTVLLLLARSSETQSLPVSAHPSLTRQLNEALGLVLEASSPSGIRPGDADILQDTVTFLDKISLNETLKCHSSIQQIGLMFLWSSTGGPYWNKNDGWEAFSDLRSDTEAHNHTCTVKALNGTILDAPVYCCYWGVSCCVDYQCGESQSRKNCGCDTFGMVTALTLPRNNLAGRLPDNWLNWISCELKYLDFSFNHLSGEINSNVSRMLKLESLALPYNKFTGSLPEELGLLPVLGVIDVTGNKLHGSVPLTLCNGGNGSHLTDLLLAHNQFEGELNINSCNNLVQLDLTDNNMYGLLPSFEGFYGLHILKLSDNSFFGTVPVTLASAPLLTDLDLSLNLLTMSITTNISDVRLLSALKVNDNVLTGTIPSQLFYNLGMLTLVNMKNNFLTGTIPDIDPQNTAVLLMDLSENYMVGQIPITFAILARPGVTVVLENTLLSCCGVGPKTGMALKVASTLGEAYSGVDWILAGNVSTLLPPYMTFSSFYQPVPASKGQNYTNMRCPGLKTNGSTDDASTVLDWTIDPAYFMYYGCLCEGGFQLVNYTEENKLPFFKCEAIKEQPWITWPWVIAVIVVGSLVVTFIIMYLAGYRMGARPAFMQQYINMRKRLQGEPRDGMVTIVTTDIEGYSELMKREPLLMGKGLKTHNYCIDKARWQFFGYTMEQEGDSFIIAFYEPFDAVAFCLQAQLLLLNADWPEKLQNSEGSVIERSRKRSVLTQALSGAARMLKRDPSRTQSDRPSKGSTNVFDTRPHTTGGGLTQQPHPRGPTICSSGATASSSSATLEDDLIHNSSGHRLRAPPLSIPEEHAVSSGESEQAKFGASGFGSNAGRCVGTFHGLRVRMGLATGYVEPGSSLRSSSIMERSKVVSDAAGGGQILMDGPTFRGVKARLVELGAVDHNGLSPSKVNLSRPTLISWMFGKRIGGGDADHAIVLDMGQYQLAGSQIATDCFFTATRVASPRPMSAPSTQTNIPESNASEAEPVQLHTTQHSHPAGEAAGTQLHLYQVLSPVLAERAHHFGSKLALRKDEWTCIDPPYFSAPGAEEASLGITASCSIPAMTMVFCILDGAKDWKLSYDKPRRTAIQSIISDVLVNTLTVVKGGYMCRLQEDEFKYMVAFPEPQEAAKWCLVIQDAMMWQDWPEWLLKFDKAKEERDERGEIVFRGPRLRMGMCHGHPRDIIPDHNGRADYHGASINSAARYMDAAAHGGQVVCDEATATNILARWNQVLSRSMLDVSQASVMDPPRLSTLPWASSGFPSLSPMGGTHPHYRRADPHMASFQQASTILPHGSSLWPDGAPARQLAGPVQPVSPAVSSDVPPAVRLGLAAASSAGPLAQLGNSHHVLTLHNGFGAETSRPASAPGKATSRPVCSDHYSLQESVTDSAPRHILESPSPPQQATPKFASVLDGTCDTSSSTSPFETTPRIASAAVEDQEPPTARLGKQASTANFSAPDLISHQGGITSAHNSAEIKVKTSGHYSSQHLSVMEEGVDHSVTFCVLAAPTTTYRTSVSAYHLGKFRYKGSDEEIPMVHLLLEAHSGRHFPSVPPKGKGNRTTVKSGLAGTSPVVELPNVGRRYYDAWRARRQDELQMTSRVAAIKSWALNLVEAMSRPGSLHSSGGRTSQAGSETSRVRPPSHLHTAGSAAAQSRSQRFLSLLTNSSPKSMQGNAKSGVSEIQPAHPHRHSGNGIVKDRHGVNGTGKSEQTVLAYGMAHNPTGSSPLGLPLGVKGGGLHRAERAMSADAEIPIACNMNAS